MSPSSLALILVSVSLTAFAQLILRKAMLVAVPGMPGLDRPLALAYHLFGNLYLWAGLASFAVSILLWLVVLAKTQVSVAYPMASLGYVIVAAGGAFFLGENVSLLRAAGVALICLGVVFVAQSA